MNVSSINSATTAYQPTTESTFKKSAQDFKALASALKSGDLSGAQQAFAAWQTDRPQSTRAASQTTNSATPANSIASALQTLQSALQSGDLSGAQSAFTALKQDMQGAGGVHGHHHHHHSGGSTSAPNSSTSSSTAATASNSSTVISLLDTQA